MSQIVGDLESGREITESPDDTEERFRLLVEGVRDYGAMSAPRNTPGHRRHPKSTIWKSAFCSTTRSLSCGADARYGHGYH